MTTNPLDAEIGRTTALVVDSNDASRRALTRMLRDFGVAQVEQVRAPTEARNLLERRSFDIVVCDFHFDGEPMSGQDLVDDLRLARILPLSTVVVMISAEAGKANVTAAAEAALDAYLIKPHTADALHQRLAQSRRRKRALKEVISLIEDSEFEQAAQMCEQRFETRGLAWVQAARLGAELWLRLDKPQAAQRLFEAILGIGAVPWARLGVARALHDRGNTNQARRSLESLLTEQPGYTDAYDVMARVLLDQGLPEKALDASREALSLTPGCVARLVKHGLLAFFYGDPDEAGTALARAARLGMNSKVFDLQGLVLLAFVQFDNGDRQGLAHSLRSITAARIGRLESDRLRRFESVVAILKKLIDRQVPEAVAGMQGLLLEIREPTFEIEAACNLLALVSRLIRREIRPVGIDHEVDVLARRFAVSHTTRDLLANSLGECVSLVKVIRDAYNRICIEAEEALSKTLEGLPDQAARILLERAESSLNARLMDLAMHTMDRHQDSIDGVDDLRARAQSLHKRFRSYGTQVRLAGDTWAPTRRASKDSTAAKVLDPRRQQSPPDAPGGARATMPNKALAMKP